MSDDWWEYKIRAFAGLRHQGGIKSGELVIETVHRGEASRDMEISIFKDRMARGEIGRIEIIDLVHPYSVKRIPE